MESATGSWRVSIDSLPAILHEAIFLRDAVGLVVESSVEIPPRLRGGIPDYSGHFSLEWRTSSGLRWALWWSELVRWSVTPQLVSLLSDPTTARGKFTESYSSPAPLFLTEDRDAFTTAELDRVRGLATQWITSQRNELRESRKPSLLPLSDSESLGSVARGTAAQLGAPIDAMKAVVVTLALSGEWSHKPIEGALLCSEDTMENEAIFAPLLAETFVSGFYRRGVVDLPGRPTLTVPPYSILDSALPIAEKPDINLRLEGAYIFRGGFELEISRSDESTGPTPLPYGRQGQPSDPEHFPNHFSGLEVVVRIEHESADVQTHDGSTAIPNRFWRRGRGPNTLWYSVRVVTPEGELLTSPRGHVTVVVTWPECGIDHRQVEFDLKELDGDEQTDRRRAW